MSTPLSNTGHNSTGLRNAVDHGVQPTHNAIDRMADCAVPAVGQLQAAAHDATDTFQSKGQALADLKDQAATTARGYVREHPLATVLVALTAGVIISRILR